MCKTTKWFLCLALIVAVVCGAMTAFAQEQTYVAENVQTGQQYEDVSAALQAADDGQIVKLLQDTEAKILTVGENTTLDLNGYELTATYASVFGNMIDGSAENTGALKVDDNKLLINTENKQLPVKTDKGYRFVEIVGFNTAWVNDSTFVFQPLFEAAACDMLKNGAAATGVSVQINVTWRPFEGSEDLDSRTFKYGDNLVTQFVNSYNASTGKFGRMFTLTLVNPENYVDLKCNTKVVSTTRVEFVPAKGSAVLKQEVLLNNEQASAIVAEGTKVQESGMELILSTTEMETSTVVVGEGETARALDIHVAGIAKDNTVPVIVTVNEMAPEFMNRGNITLFHVENGEAVEMTRVFSVEEVDAHNEFYYDIETGSVTMALKSFSEIAVVANEVNAWNGDLDYSWYTKGEPYKIANADQLAGFGAIVGGMAEGIDRDAFAGKTITLLSDINLGDKDNANGNLIFYPIGYYYNGDDAAPYSTVYSFKGTFDGNGHTIANFYQNTWEIKGDYDGNYYKDAMGLFGYVVNGTVKNLTVDSFSSDGEFTPTGVIAAYAEHSTFENIAITNCNPRVYNTGNGGIIGIGGRTDDTSNQKLVLKNITVDNTNKISALWGSWDVACGGLVGMFRGNAAPGNGTIHFENCHVAAEIDVYNDVCANYQYYAYRYSGMLIGSVRHNETVDGKVYPVTEGITADNCTVKYDEWVNYYYCELVSNSIASYTHDYQFSRLVPIASLDEIKSGDTWTKTGNYVLVENGQATCYHIAKDGDTLKQHNHIDSGYETVGNQKVLVENNQCVYLPFPEQLFTGYSWGVTSKVVGDFEGTDSQIKVSEGQYASSVRKFEGVAAERYETGAVISIGELFKSTENSVGIVDKTVQVFVSPADENSTVSGTYTAGGKWNEGTLVLSGSGNATITISDYFFCTPTTINVTVEKKTPEVTAPTANELTFTGNEQALVSLGSTTGGTMFYSLGEDGEYKATIPTATDAGTYNVYYKVVGNENYNDVGRQLVRVTIKKADPADPNLPDDLSATEGEKLSSIVLTNGFTWVNGDETVTVGENKYKANYDCGDANYNTVEVEIVVTGIKREPVQKFESKFTGNFLYRVGNQNAVKLDSLFMAKDGATIGNVSVTFEAINGTAASGAYTPNTTWTNGTIQFSGTGVVKVTIKDDDQYCDPTELYLEVVDAINTTTATNATANNVVLLNNAGFGSLEVSGGYTLYGNGFTMTCASDSAALDTGYSFVTLDNGTLDNVQIVCPNFDYAVLYKSNMTESGNRSETTDRTRYFNVKSGVMVSGNSQILNSRISGARAAVNVSGGDLLIDNSRIELGAVASILVGAANSLTLRDVTLVQRPTQSTYDPNKIIMGFSVLFMGDNEGKTTQVTLEGELVQYAWADESYKKYVPSAGNVVIQEALGKTEFLHDLDGDGENESLNLGLAYMPEVEGWETYELELPTINDQRENISAVPYELVKISQAYVYSYKNSKGTVDAFKTESKYEPNKYGDIITVTYSDTADGLEAGKSFGTDGWVYELNVDLDKHPSYALDFSQLSMSVNGVSVADYKVNGNAKPTSPVAVTAGGVTYTLTATVDGKEHTAYYKVTGTETSKESPSLVATNYEAGLCVASSYGGTWHGAAPALQGIEVKYWSVAEKQYKTIKLSDYTPTTKGQQNGTNTTWTYSPANGDFTLTLTGGQVHSSNNVYAMPVVCDGKLYFVAASSKGLVNSGNSARTIPVSYTFKDNNNGDVLTFSHTWSVAENKDAQYKYSDFCSGTLTKLESGSSGGGSCLTPDTLVTLADGTQVRMDILTGTEQLLVWNMVTGQLDSAPILFVDSDPEVAVDVVTLTFSDGTDVKVIYEHGFWDYDLNKYVYLDENAAAYIGHTFAKQNGDQLEKVTLTDVVIETELTTAWSPVTADHLCYFVNGMLSMPGGVGGLFNIFEVDPETMTYDLEKMAQDIETYGLFTYEELKSYAPSLTEDMFELCGGAYLKISIGKGNMTMDELVAMIERYCKFF